MPASVIQGTSPIGKPAGGATGGADRSTLPRWFWPGLLAICVVGGIVRFAQRAEYLRDNPLAKSPAVDAMTYWNWAGRIAAGQLTEDVPFFSAPLYPYLLGAVRAGGGGLPTIYTLQALLDLVTAALLAWIARRRFGAPVGLLAAALFLLMLDPASFSLRILPSTIQLPLVCLAWLTLLRAKERPSWQRGALAAALLGLLALAYPPAMLCLPIFCVWWWWNAGRRLADIERTAIAVAAGIAVICPATFYNYHACGEFIPISAQAGVTFAHGNGPGATGTYTPIPGVSIYREAQNVDTFRIYRAETGQTPTWNAVNRYFLKRGWDYWRSDAGRALRLLARKAYWFLTGRNYGDIYQPTMEIAEGLTARLRLTPLHTAWLLPLALLAIAVWFRRFNRYLPELMLFGIPLLVVIVFLYHSRYRAPAIPVIVVACSWTVWQGVHWRRHTRWTIAAAGALLIGFGLDVANRLTGFDSLGPRWPAFYNALGTAESRAGRLEEAVAYYEKALKLRPDYPETAANLSRVLLELGRTANVLAELQRAVRSNPGDAFAHDSLARALYAHDRPAEALSHFRKAVELNPRAPDLRNNLGNALRSRGDLAGAIEQYRAALKLDPTCAEAHLNLGNVLVDQGHHEAALRQFGEALRFDSSLTSARLQIVRIQLGRGDARGAIASLRSACERLPRDRSLANESAWYLATIPGLAPADRAEALRLARRATSDPVELTPSRLDTLAAALAANGQFAEAVRVAERAAELAERHHADVLAGQFRERLELYKAGKPYVEPLKPTIP